MWFGEEVRKKLGLKTEYLSIFFFLFFIFSVFYKVIFDFRFHQYDPQLNFILQIVFN